MKCCNSQGQGQLGMGQLLALGKLGKAVEASLIKENDYDIELAWEILVIILLALLAVYLIVKHTSAMKKIYRHCAHPCCEVIPELLSNKQNVTVYQSTLTTYCYLDLDHIYAAPHDIKLIQSEIPIVIKLHKNCFSSYLTIIHKNLGLQVGTHPNNVWKLHNTISIPNYLKNIVSTILQQNFTAEIAIGNDNIYRPFPH